MCASSEYKKKKRFTFANFESYLFRDISDFSFGAKRVVCVPIIFGWA